MDAINQPGKEGAPVEEKFAYLYQKGIKQVERSCKNPRVLKEFLMFNNCFRDYAIRNAKQMKLLLAE